MVLREETMHIGTIGVHILDKAKLLYKPTEHKSQHVAVILEQLILKTKVCAVSID